MKAYTTIKSATDDFVRIASFTYLDNNDQQRWRDEHVWTGEISINLDE